MGRKLSLIVADKIGARLHVKWFKYHSRIVDIPVNAEILSIQQCIVRRNPLIVDK